MATPVLYHIEVSHYNEKARWALDYKGVPYSARVPMPGLHGLTALRVTRGKQRRLPVLEIDGTRIGDSTATSPRSRSTRPSRRCTRPVTRSAAGRWRSRTGSTSSSARS